MGNPAGKNGRTPNGRKSRKADELYKFFFTSLALRDFSAKSLRLVAARVFRQQPPTSRPFFQPKSMFDARASEVLLPTIRVS